MEAHRTCSSHPAQPEVSLTLTAFLVSEQRREATVWHFMVRSWGFVMRNSRGSHGSEIFTWMFRLCYRGEQWIQNRLLLEKMQQRMSVAVLWGLCFHLSPARSVCLDEPDKYSSSHSVFLRANPAACLTTPPILLISLSHYVHRNTPFERVLPSFKALLPRPSSSPSPCKVRRRRNKLHC